MQLSCITIYPVKSCAGINLDSVTLDRFGPVGDRRWLVVDERGRFLSQRDQARMALVRVEQLPGGIRLSLGGSSTEAAIPGTDASELRVSIWEDSVRALLADGGAGEWLGQRGLQRAGPALVRRFHGGLRITERRGPSGL